MIKGTIEQDKIWNEIVNTNNDVIVNAGAGTGKTFTIVEGANRASEARKGFLCFNKSIQTELQERLPEGVEAKTFHALGMKAVRDSVGKIKMNKWKVKNIIDEIFGRDYQAQPLIKLIDMNVEKLNRDTWISQLLNQEIQNTQIIKKSLGNPCANNIDCLSNNCYNGSCIHGNSIERFGGCSSGGGSSHVSCNSNSDCSGGVCNNGHCVERFGGCSGGGGSSNVSCNSNSDCYGGVCNNGKCVERFGCPNNACGSSQSHCSKDSDCPNGLSCNNNNHCS